MCRGVTVLGGIWCVEEVTVLRQKCGVEGIQYWEYLRYRVAIVLVVSGM